MKVILILGILFYSMVNACNKKEDNRFIFFLHNRFLESHDLNELHPEYGRTEYVEIIDEFKESGFNIISEKRNENVNAREYANGIVQQIDSLIDMGIKPNRAQYVSTIANNSNLNFVFIASFREMDIENIPEINYCGNILTIYEKTDPFGVSAQQRKVLSTCKISRFKEIELNTGIGHGFIFKPLKEWIEPTIKWAKGNYNIKEK